MNTKKIFSFAVAFILSLQALFCGENFGFKLIKNQNYNQTTQVFLYEHEKTGAQVVWIKNDDTNRAFNLCFNTRSYDDVGLPHIFEHSCLARLPFSWFFG